MDEQITNETELEKISDTKVRITPSIEDYPTIDVNDIQNQINDLLQQNNSHEAKKAEILQKANDDIKNEDDIINTNNNNIEKLRETLSVITGKIAVNPTVLEWTTGQ